MNYSFHIFKSVVEFKKSESSASKGKLNGQGNSMGDGQMVSGRVTTQLSSQWQSDRQA
jgi:hypothetical protein